MYDQGHTNPVAFDLSPTDSTSPMGTRSPQGSRSPRGARSPRGGRSPGARSPVVQVGRAQPALADEERKDAATILMWSLNAWYNKQRTEPGARTKKKLRRLRTIQAQEDEKTLYHGEWAHDLSLDHPNYGSIFLQIKEANSEAEGSYEFIRKTGDIVSNTLFVTVILGMLLALPVGMISIGVKHLNDCPKEEKIPIYLLVGGCFGFLKVLSLLWKQVRSRRYEKLDEIYEPDEDNGDVIMSKSSKFSEALLSAFLFIWFICGNYWVFGIWRPNFKQMLHEPSNWCDKTVYMFAVIQIMIGYSLMGLILLLMIILSICHRYTADKS